MENRISGRKLIEFVRNLLHDNSELPPLELQKELHRNKIQLSLGQVRYYKSRAITLIAREHVFGRTDAIKMFQSR